VIDAITRQGADPLGSTPGEFDSYLKAEVAKWKKLISASGTPLDRFQRAERRGPFVARARIAA
jgi:hypothetical protein